MKRLADVIMSRGTPLYILSNTSFDDRNIPFGPSPNPSLQPVLVSGLLRRRACIRL